jgi:hypothetical protein
MGEKMTKPDIKKAISLEDEENENTEEAEAEIEEEEKPKPKKPQKKKKPKPQEKFKKEFKNIMKNQEIRQQQEQEAYSPQFVPEAHKIYRELKKLRKILVGWEMNKLVNLLNTFKEVEIKYGEGNIIVNTLSPPAIPLKPLKKLGDYKEAPPQNNPPQAPQTQNSMLVLTKNPPLPIIPSKTAVAEPSLCPPPLSNNLNNPNEIILDNSPPLVNLKRCPNCNKKFKSFFGIFGSGRSKIINENGEVKQSLFCKQCGWHKEIRFVV